MKTVKVIVHEDIVIEFPQGVEVIAKVCKKEYNLSDPLPGLRFVTPSGHVEEVYWDKGEKETRDAEFNRISIESSLTAMRPLFP